MTIHKDLDMGSYLAMEALSGGVAFEAVNRSPLHARNRMLTSRNSKVADIGTIVHSMLLEGHADNVVLVDAKDWRTNAAKKQRDQAYADGKVPLLKDQMPEVETMVNTLKAQLIDTEVGMEIGRGDAELTVEWLETVGDMQFACKARPDYLTDKFHISLKTTQASAEPASFSKRMLSTSGYDFSLAFYDRGLKANGINVEHRIVVLEQNAPYGLSVIALDPAKRAVADAKVEQSLKIWAECLKTGRYPGYTSQTWYAELLPWELADAEEFGQEMVSGGKG